MSPSATAVARSAKARELYALSREVVATARNLRHANILRRHLAKRRAAA